ncbi:MAG TPA: class I SAM-dependent methyltransferase [Micromonosporaceae bacterium]|nr:class I SAM-dependent methyltransferase [Micromonosporaceae bacterium]HCU50924.1 class I SAM-dependent methyltransferase [Micromonosporaceae bacterium]
MAPSDSSKWDTETVDFYDRLAAGYAEQFADWQASQDKQAAVLDRFLSSVCPARRGAVLDTACGIGTQAIGLARLGYTVRGTDISAASIEQARRSAHAAGVDIEFGVADFRDLATLPDGFDAVVCCDNALPHLLTDADMLDALRGMRARLRPGGLLLITTRDYDQARRDRAAGQAPRAFTDGQGRERMVLQLWQWESEDTYHLRHVTLTRDGSTWQGTEHNVRYRAITRGELTTLMRDAGLNHPRWHMPDSSGYYQPIVVANA